MRNSVVKLKMLSLPVLLDRQEVPIFPACNCLISAVFSARGFVGMRNNMVKPKMLSLPTLLANSCCFHRKAVSWLDEHNGVKITLY